MILPPLARQRTRNLRVAPLARLSTQMSDPLGAFHRLRRTSHTTWASAPAVVPSEVTASDLDSHTLRKAAQSFNNLEALRQVDEINRMLRAHKDLRDQIIAGPAGDGDPLAAVKRYFSNGGDHLLRPLGEAGVLGVLYKQRIDRPEEYKMAIASIHNCGDACDFVQILKKHHDWRQLDSFLERHQLTGRRFEYLFDSADGLDVNTTAVLVLALLRMRTCPRFEPWWASPPFIRAPNIHGKRVLGMCDTTRFYFRYNMWIQELQAHWQAEQYYLFGSRLRHIYDELGHLEHAADLQGPQQFLAAARPPSLTCDLQLDAHLRRLRQALEPACTIFLHHEEAIANIRRVRASRFGRLRQLFCPTLQVNFFDLRAVGASTLHHLTKEFLPDMHARLVRRAQAILTAADAHPRN